MSFATHLECSLCQNRYPVQELINLCSCGSPLLVRYDLKIVKQVLHPDQIAQRPGTMWRYKELLPVMRLEDIISLGEGWTPLHSVPALGKALNLNKLWIKDESLNPTGSFKARGLSVAVSMAGVLGARRLAIPSAGNAAGALAAYAARGGLEAYIFMPRDSPPANRIECEIAGARVFLVNGLITECGKQVAQRKEEEGWFDVSTLKEPYRVEGKKTLGLELAEQLGWRLPDAIIYPTGGGTGLIGMWKAFDEMEALGWIGSQRPRMITVQASGCAPIVKAFQENRERAEEWLGATTLASGLRVPKAIGDFLMLRILRQSQGTAVAVTDSEMMEDLRLMGACEGIFAAPEGAATVSALRKLLKSGFVRPEQEVVLFNTGSGMKYQHLFGKT
jgi:threonine synthase